jgi:hypothetical protein
MSFPVQPGAALQEPFVITIADDVHVFPSKQIKTYDSTRLSVIAWCCFVLAAGGIWGAASSIGKPSVERTNIIASKMFLATWAVKGWPQLIMNFRRQATLGLCMDTYYLEMVGFISLVVFTGYDINVLGTLTRYTYNFDLCQLCLAIELMICTAVIICQMYSFHGYRRSKHKGVNSVSNKANFFVSTYIFFNVLYLILLFVPEAHGGTAVSANQYFSSFMYAAGGFLAIRWIPTMWNNALTKKFEGISLSAVGLECFGAVALLIMVGSDGYNNGEFGSSAAGDVPSNVVSTIARKLMLSIVGASSFFSCIVLCNQSVRYDNTQAVRSDSTAGVDMQPPTRNNSQSVTAGTASYIPPGQPVWVDVTPLPTPDIRPTGNFSPAYSVSSFPSPASRTSVNNVNTSSLDTLGQVGSPASRSNDASAPPQSPASVPFWEPPHPAHVTLCPSTDAVEASGTHQQVSGVSPPKPAKKPKKAKKLGRSAAPVTASTDEKDNDENHQSLVTRDYGF